MQGIASVYRRVQKAAAFMRLLENEIHVSNFRSRLAEFLPVGCLFQTQNHLSNDGLVK